MSKREPGWSQLTGNRKRPVLPNPALPGLVLGGLLWEGELVRVSKEVRRGLQRPGTVGTFREKY